MIFVIKWFKKLRGNYDLGWLNKVLNIYEMFL